MLQKILAQLVVKYPGVQKTVLGLIAAKIAAKVTEESGIDAAITEFETNSPLTPKEMADFYQVETDRRVAEILKKNPPTPPKKDDPTDPAPGAGGSDPLAKQVEALSKKLAEMEARDSQKTFVQQLHVKLGEKKIPLKLAERWLPEKQEDVDEMATQIEANYNEFRQGLIDEGLTTSTAPVVGKVTPAASAEEKKAEAQIKKWASAGKKPETAQV